MDGQRRLLHDVSHELRSPLARLQAAIGLAHQQPERPAASLERIERESVRMDRLVGELLTLSRLEASATRPPTEDSRLGGDGRPDRRRRPFRGRAAGPQHRCMASRRSAVRGAPDLLWRAIENVVRNAIKHGPEGGSHVELRPPTRPGAHLSDGPRPGRRAGSDLGDDLRAVLPLAIDGEQRRRPRPRAWRSPARGRGPRRGISAGQPRRRRAARDITLPLARDL